MNELKPCPFCGGEQTIRKINGHYVLAATNHKRGCIVRELIPYASFDTEAEAIAAWNTRAAYEMEGWFYLPKPKEQLFNYTTGFMFDDLSLKATGTVDVYALTNAVRKWQEEELNQHIVERICEVFKPERKCRDLGGTDEHGGQVFNCSECGCVLSLFDKDGVNTLLTRYIYDYPRYCPACGAKVG